jgi:hypothetical protein
VTLDARFDNPGGCFRIGEDPAHPQTACDGPDAPLFASPFQFDDVRVFDRALSAAEIMKLRREGLPD